MNRRTTCARDRIDDSSSTTAASTCRSARRRGEFLEHYSFIIREQLRVTKHVQQLTTTKATNGYMGMTDFGVMAGELWQQAHYDGIRNGLEVAASYVDKVSDSFPTVGQVPGELVREMLTEMRDYIRLYALQIPDPSPMPDE